MHIAYLLNHSRLSRFSHPDRRHPHSRISPKVHNYIPMSSFENLPSMSSEYRLKPQICGDDNITADSSTHATKLKCLGCHNSLPALFLPSQGYPRACLAHISHIIVLFSSSILLDHKLVSSAQSAIMARKLTHPLLSSTNTSSNHRSLSGRSNPRPDVRRRKIPSEKRHHLRLPRNHFQRCSEIHRRTNPYKPAANLPLFRRMGILSEYRLKYFPDLRRPNVHVQTILRSHQSSRKLVDLRIRYPET